MSLADAVKNGPRMTAAKTAHIEAQIKLAEAKGKKASDQAAALRKRAKGDGPLAKSRQLRAAAHQSAADRHRATANQLRADLAKAKAAEAAREAKHVKRTVASTAAEGLTPNAASQPGPAKASQAKRGGQTKPAKPTQRSAQPTKGTPAMTAATGEAVDVETTEAMLADLKTKVADIRSTFDNAGGSLASVGLNKLANAMNKADDALGSVDTGITDAERELAPHKDIADIAQSTGEMANSPGFYGV